MAEKWDKQLMDFLKRTGEELKVEAQRLMVEVKDPANQAKVKEGLDNLRTWAVATGKQAAERIESAVRHVEESVEKAFKEERPPEPGPRPSPEPGPLPQAEKKAAAKTGTAKSIGRKKTAAKAPRKKAAAKTGTAKSIGRKRPSRPAS